MVNKLMNMNMNFVEMDATSKFKVIFFYVHHIIAAKLIRCYSVKKEIHSDDDIHVHILMLVVCDWV